ncbi:hypothetical protein [Dactylosporangium aurantiacum]|uniref:hypothetical protein n=1 Tax=Dactylosporangium aurantiacum TaxID=35754 RepID=UPI0006934CAD|nr:hypothetical protein [Dactylosporangium aurantiacum]MDG6107399.1 hypothetical protein [Dactylosporangium aurantiacum]
MKAFTVAGVLLVALLTGASGKPSPPPGPPLPGPPAVIEPGAPPSTLPTLNDLPSLREPSGRSVAPSGSAAAPPPAGGPDVKTTSTPGPAETTRTSRRSSGWIGLGVVIVIAATVALLVLRRRRHT